MDTLPLRGTSAWFWNEALPAEVVVSATEWNACARRPPPPPLRRADGGAFANAEGARRFPPSEPRLDARAFARGPGFSSASSVAVR